jgi:hypothetical protein
VFWSLRETFFPDKYGLKPAYFAPESN